MGLRSIAEAAFAMLLVLAAATGPAAAAGTPGEPMEAGPESIAGRLLVADRAMSDPRFAESVIFMVRHDETGAFGIIVNRFVIARPLGELFVDMGHEAEGAEGLMRLHFGGPVEIEIGFVLHTADYEDDSSIAVGGRYALNSGIEVLRRIAAGAGPRRYLFAFGYAGWGPGQLDNELQRNGWLSVPADDGLIFGGSHDNRWERAMAKLGINITMLSGDAGHA